MHFAKISCGARLRPRGTSGFLLLAAALSLLTAADVTAQNRDALESRTLAPLIPAGGAPSVVVNPGGAGYGTLGQAVVAINNGVHTGALTIDINASTVEAGPVVLNSSGAGAASYTSITLRPLADGLVIAGSTANGRGLIEFNGADNITLDGDNPGSGGINRNLTLQNTAASTATFTSVIRIALNATTVNSANNITLRNLNLAGSSTGANVVTATSTGGPENTTFGIFAGGGAADPTSEPAPITSVLTNIGAGAVASNLVIDNNRILTAARAVSINGAATSVFSAPRVTGNDIGNPTAGEVDQVTSIGITLQGSPDAVISDNTVYVEGYVRASAATHGINVGVNNANVSGALIERNRVDRVRNNDGQSWSAFGINLNGEGHTVRNNFVSGVINSQTAGTGAFGTTFGAYGIRIVGGTGHQIHHNSVHLYGAMQGATSTNLTAAFVIAGLGRTGVDVRNNAFSNQIAGGNPGGTRNTVVYLPSGITSAMDLTFNNNDYFEGSDALSTLAQVGDVFATSVAYLAADFDPSSTTPAENFRSYTSTASAAGTNDNASLKFDPQFLTDSDLHLSPLSLLESAGVDVGVVEDIDGEPRGAVPDIGADELDVTGPGVIEFALTLFDDPEGATASIGLVRGGGSTGIVSVTATVTDGTGIGGASCGPGVDYVNPGPQLLSFADGVVLQAFDVVLCSDASLEPTETATVTLSNPLGGATIGSNNPATLDIVDVPPPFAGVVNVGTGEVFESLTNPGGFFDAVNAAGLAGDLVANITSDLLAETGTVPLDPISETGAGGYTLTVRPSGGARVVSGTAATGNGLIVLNGADRVVFDGSLGSENDRSLTITNNQTGTSTVIWIKSGGAGNGAHDNVIRNCNINGAAGATATTTAGIVAGGNTIGAAGEAPNNNNTIEGNWIYRVQNSLYSQGALAPADFDVNWQIIGNEFGAATAGDRNSFRGMLIGNARDLTVSGNLIHGIHSAPATGAAMSGIQLAFQVDGGVISGNRIQDIRSLSPTGTGAFGMQIGAASTASNVAIVNNFIRDIAAPGSANLASNGHGINITAGGGYAVLHNSINMDATQASGTTSALLVGAGVVAGALDVRNNIFANTAGSGALRYAVNSQAAAAVFASIDFNDYFSLDILGFLGGDQNNLAAWQAATGQDTASLATDPLFVSATDLHLLDGSGMIDAGTPIAGVDTDIDGELRSPTAPDIGADEFVVTVTVTAVAGTGQGTITPPTQEVALGADAAFEVTPDPGWEVLGVTGTTCAPVDQGGGIWIASNITQACEVTANFELGIISTTTTLDVIPETSRVNVPVTFAVTVTAAGAAALDGQVTVEADTGESCSSNSGTVDGTETSFSCEISFATTGPRTAVATFSGSATHSDSSSAAELVTVNRVADLSVEVSGDGGPAGPGDTVGFLIAFRNAGPDAAPGSIVSVTVDPPMISAEWTCSALGGAICPAADGVGDIGAVANLPAGGGLDYVLTGVVPSSIPDGLFVEGIITADDSNPNLVSDPDTSNNLDVTVTALGPLFVDGFE